MASHVVGVPTSGVAWDDDSGGTPALAVPVGSNPAYHARSMSLKRVSSQQQGEAASALSRRRVSRKVAPEGDEQQMANTRVGVSEAFLEDFLTRVLPQFGLTREALSTPKTRDEWLARLQHHEEHIVEVDEAHLVKAENGDVLVDLGDGLQARKSDVEHVRKLIRVPRCRNISNWELVEAEVDLKELPDKFDADARLRVRVKGDSDDSWFFLPARDVALVQTSDIVDFVIQPITQWKNGKLLVEKLETKKNKDGKDDVVKSDRKTYVDHVADVHPKGRDWVERNYFGKADIFVSHAWMDAYQDFSDAMTGGSSEGSKHYQNKLASQILHIRPVTNVLNGYFRTWKQYSAAWWQRWIAFFVTGLVLFPFNVINFVLVWSGISLIVRLLPVSWLKRTVSKMRQLHLIDRDRRWVDIFCKNQWVVNSDDTETELQDGVGNVDWLWLVTHSWHTPHALRRAWCQFELRAARLQKVGIVGIACDEEDEKLRNVCRAVLYKWWFWLSVINPFSCGNALKSSYKTAEYWRLKSCLHSVDARTAEARFDTDKEHILELIRQGVQDGDDGGSSNEGQQGEAAINAHNEELKTSYLNLISRMMNGYVGGKFEEFIHMNLGYCLLLLVIIPFFVAKTAIGFLLWYYGLVLAFGCIAFVFFLARCVETQIKVYYILPLLRTEEEKRDLNRKAIYWKWKLYVVLFVVFVFAILIHNLPALGFDEKCAAHPLASEPLVPSCTFSALSTAPRDVREYRNHVIGTYYQMPNKTINGKPVFEAFNTETESRVKNPKILDKIVFSCSKRYLYYTDTDKWIVGKSENMEIGKGRGWIFSNTRYADSPAWLPADERWRLWHDGESYYGAVQLTCRHLPAAPPPPAATPACTFALRDDAPSAVKDADHVQKMLGTYYLMSNNKRVNDRPVFELKRDRYLYYANNDEWVVGSAGNMEIGKTHGWSWIFSNTKYADSPAWLPADERWRLYHDGKWHGGAMQLTCRNMPAAPPPPPLPPISTPACTFALRDDAPSAVKDADHVLGAYYLMLNKTVNDRPVFKLNSDRYLYYTDSSDNWIVGRPEDMERGKSTGWIHSSTTYVNSPAWLPADERWKLYYGGEWHYGVLQLTCRHLPAAPPPNSS